MCSDYKAIKLLKSLLRNKDRWELKCEIDAEFAEYGEKALSIASQRLKSISLLFLWRRYCDWRKIDHSEYNSDDYFHSFISDTAWDIAVDGLTGLDKVIFSDLGYFKFKFK